MHNRFSKYCHTAQTDRIYIYEFGGSLYPHGLSDPNRSLESVKFEGKVRTRHTAYPHQIQNWHNSGTTMENISLPFKLECVK